MEIKARSAEEAFHKVLNALNSPEALETAPRGMKIKEIINCCLQIDNPRDRIISCPERKFSSAYAFGELAWYLSGRNDLKMMSYYSKFMERGTDDGVTLNSAYGYRIFTGQHPLIPFDQWEDCKQKMTADPDTRQAIIHLHTPNNKKTNDEVCTLTLQFFIRNGKLDMITTMRSNDIVLGFTYDVFSFTMLHEIMANEMGVALGTYYHNAGSMHIYENKFDMLEKHTVSTLPPMLPFKYGRDGFKRMIEIEEAFRVQEENATTLPNMDIRAITWADDPLLAFAAAAYMGKALPVVMPMSIHAKAAAENVLCDALRKVNETYADILQLQCSFTQGGQKVIVEGIDASGKSTYVQNVLDDASFLTNETVWHAQHYGKPTAGFGYLGNYEYNLRTPTDVVFDRFFPSELVYSLFRDNSMLSMHDVMTLLESVDSSNTKFVFIIAENDDQLKTVCSRLTAEDEHMRQKNLVQNNAYKFLAELLRLQGFNVEVKGIYDLRGGKKKRK